MRRRTLLGLAGGAALAPLAAQFARAQAYPARTVNIVVPYPAGGATDVIARLIADKLRTTWNQSIVVENRPGAGTVAAAQYVARAEPDGYTLFETTSAHTISASLYKKLTYDPIRDFAAITLTAVIPLVLVTAKDVPAKTVDEFVAWAKTQTGVLVAASTGVGTAQHLTAELFKARTGIPSQHVPFRGDTPMITDLLAGRAHFAFATLSAVLPHIQSGDLRGIALAHPRRVAAVKDIPTFAEAGMPGFEAATWFGTFAPAKLPDELRARIYRDISAIVAEPAMTQRLVDMGADVTNLAPADFDAFIQAETKRWAEAVRIARVSID
ncbi:tripartite tricarboxylate transporter substrate binding protein [Enterovirga rhinocerotis]|uniref:Tripartite-type tricarboxylate transporter receptor subunit TctC n=1 Tax=Enterovirga rhinocerotis TaxID=1339210 RepID=A0A4R7BTE8_9HYPH|nr:tripartite tricarboxylate transporter substrate binding protein [Enterovirga rhinocerotis]TDR88192.1 tripartite-type tricarboxylate transporter receptor subunit TctC [Enterovirga rhinocerotis]